MPNIYSETQLDFIRSQVYTPCKLAGIEVSHTGLYTQDDVHRLAEWMVKNAAWNNWQDWQDWGSGALNATGDGGWLWDRSQNAAGNLAGYGGVLGSTAGSIGGFALGTAAAPVAPIVSSLAGGAAGGAAGGMAGRGLGYSIGSGIDWLMGNKPGENQPGFTSTVFDPTSIAFDSAFGMIPGTGLAARPLMKGVATKATKDILKNGVRGLPGSIARLPSNLMKSTMQNAKHYTPRVVRDAKKMTSRWGLKPFVAAPGQTMMQRGVGMAQNVAHNAKRMVTQAAPRQMLGRQTKQWMAGSIPWSIAGSLAQGQTNRTPGSMLGGRPFANTQGYTQVVGNKNKGFSGVTPMNRLAHS